MKSMTGFGTASGVAEETTLLVEIRSVNQRNLDIKVSLPREYGRWESEFRRTVGAIVERGRVELYIGRNSQQGPGSVKVNSRAAQAWIKAWKSLQKEFGLQGELELSLLQGRSDIFVVSERASVAAEELAVVRGLLDKALQAHLRDRKREGGYLKKDMLGRLRALRKTAAGVANICRGMAGRLRARLESRVADLLGSGRIDEARLAQEVALLADRTDVTEELVRLDSHVDALVALTRVQGPIGKRFDFLLQEVGRELNTISSKVGELAVKNLVLDGKVEMERLREQVQNVE